MFGRLPWLAFERRMRALRFLVFFDIGDEASGEKAQRHRGQTEGSALTPAGPAVRVVDSRRVGLCAEVALAVVRAASAFWGAIGAWGDRWQCPR